MKFIAKLLVTCFSLVCVGLLVAVVYFWVNINSIAKDAIETVGTGLTKTNVSVESVNLSPLSGNGTIHNLEIANPPGYDGKDIIELKSMKVVVDLNSLTEDVVVIRSLEIKEAELNLEQEGLLKNNINELLDNLEKPIAKQEIAEVEQDEASTVEVQALDHDLEKGKKKVIIQSFMIKNSTLKIKSDLLGEKVVQLPNIELKDIGSQENGLPLQAVALQLFMPIMNETVQKADELGFHFRGRSKQLLENAAEEIKEKGADLIDSIIN